MAERGMASDGGGVVVRLRRRSTERVIFDLAADQHGVVSRRALIDRGISGSSLDRRVGDLLQRVGPGLYVVDALRDEMTDLAIAIASVPGGAAARQTAAHLGGAFQFSGAAFRRNGFRVVTAHSVRGRSELARFHQSRFLPARHLALVHGLPATTMARTLCDLAMEVAPAHLRDIVDSALTDGLVTLDEFVACHLELARRGRKGTRALRDVVEDRLADEQPVPESLLELRLAQALARRGIWLEGQFRPPWFDGRRFVADFADVDGRTILEADGRRYHDTVDAFARDRERDRLAALHGWVVLRVCWRDVVADGAAIDEVAAIIRQRRLRPSA